MRRRIWLRTNDPDLVVCVSDYEDGNATDDPELAWVFDYDGGKITIIRRSNPEEVKWFHPPEDTAFDLRSLPCTLGEETKKEVREAIAFWAVFYPGLMADFDRVVVTFVH